MQLLIKIQSCAIMCNSKNLLIGKPLKLNGVDRCNLVIIEEFSQFRPPLGVIIRIVTVDAEFRTLIIKFVIYFRNVSCYVRYLIVVA